jgi:hypothetical protein
MVPISGPEIVFLKNPSTPLLSCSFLGASWLSNESSEATTSPEPPWWVAPCLSPLFLQALLVNNQTPLLPLNSHIIWRICVRIRKVINIRQKQSVQVCIPTKRWMLLNTVASNGRIVTWNTTVGWPKVGLAMVSLIFASFVFYTDLISDVRVKTICVHEIYSTGMNP